MGVSNRSDRRLPWLFAGAALALGAIGLVMRSHGEAVPEGEGLGWDGVLYGRIAAHPSAILELGFPERHQRILPSLVVHLLLRASGSDFSPTRIAGCFAVMNVGLLVGIAAVWGRTAVALRLRQSTSWLGFCALVVSYAAQKIALYYPVLTDTTALFLGVVAAHGYFTRSRRLMLFAFTLGLITWSSFAPSYALLIAWPRRDASEEQTPTARFRRQGDLLALAVSLLVVTLIVRSCYDGTPHPGLRWALLPVSVAAAGGYLFFALRSLLLERVHLHPRALWQAVDGRAALIVGLLWGTTLLLLRLLPHDQGFSFASVFLTGEDSVAIRSVRQPLVFFVEHVSYLGCLPLLLVACWGRVASLARAQGPGMLLFVVSGVLFSLTTESRHLTHLVPPLVVLAAMAVDKERWPSSMVAALAALSLVMSRLWLPLNLPAFGRTTWFPRHSAFLSFGMPRAWNMYVIELWVALLSTGLLLVWRRWHLNSLRASEQAGERPSGPGPAVGLRAPAAGRWGGRR
jgi:hypothetical protein